MYNWPGRRSLDHYGVCFAHEIINVGDTPIGLTESVYMPVNEKPAALAMITLENGDVRFREDGGDPGGNQGHRLNRGDMMIVRDLANISKILFVRRSRNPKLYVSYYR